MIDETELRVRGSVVRTAAEMFRRGNFDLDEMPRLVKSILDGGMWRQRAIPQEDWRLSREFDWFPDFVSASQFEGLGTTVQMLKDVCQRDIRVVDLIDDACQREGGRPPETYNNIIGFQAPLGTSRDQALRRLRKDRPDLHAQVLAEEISPHAAMVAAGLRPRTFSVRAGDPQSAARTLRKYYTDPEQRALLAKRLTEED